MSIPSQSTHAPERYKVQVEESQYKLTNSSLFIISLIRATVL